MKELSIWALPIIVAVPALWVFYDMMRDSWIDIQERLRRRREK